MKLHLTDEQIAEIWKDAPEWANWFAIDEAFSVFYYEELPEIFENYLNWDRPLERRETRIFQAWLGNWRELCFERPNDGICERCKKYKTIKETTNPFGTKWCENCRNFALSGMRSPAP
jgi:hypothetical protein